MSLNKVMLIGNVGQDPEIRATQQGKEIANLSIATSEKWKDKNTGEKREKTEWHRVVIFSEGLVKVIKQYVKKGDKLYIEGQLQTRKWQDQSGQDRYSTEVVLQGYNAKIDMLSSKNSGGNQGGGGYSQQGGQSYADPANPPQPDLDDEIPFSWALAIGVGSLLSFASYSGGIIT